ncbi:MAG TPA: succinate dehydrogenase, cytochrome b556 subunit [Caulobacteraceae bacterium]|nr:succinate dehydrogenase, cytochrome b556 subunit [Caulobacteraceae bacterium]
MSESPTTDAAARAADRPLSPHILAWRWHVTMATSILHRLTGAALYVGALILVGWALALASGPDAYDLYAGALGSPLGLIVLIGLSLCLFFHLANGIRHLVWDFGRGFAPKTADATAWLVLAIAVAATVALWAWLLLRGGGA